MYTIKHAALRSGVAVSTIRAWERRYAVVQPARTPAGYRLYDERAIERLVAMRQLVEDGWQPSVAAAEIAERGPIAASGRAATPPVATADLAGGGTNAAEDVRSRFVDAAAAMDEGALGQLLDDVFARGSFERVASELLFPALHALGDAWASGEVSVAAEHLASHAVLRRLAVGLEAAGHGTSASEAHVVVGLPPGSRHELGALAFAVALRRSGVPVAYLGPDLPPEDWARAGRGATAAVIGVVTPRDRRAARLVADRLREEGSVGVIAVGGAAADGLDLPGVLLLSGSIEAAVAQLSDAVRAARA